MGKKDIPKMRPKELRKLYEKLEKTWKKLARHSSVTAKHLYATYDAMAKTQRLEQRTLYWLGKQKALKCPAFKPCAKGSRSAQCFVHDPQYGESYRYLFRYKCANCKIPPNQAKIKATWNGIFGQKVP